MISTATKNDRGFTLIEMLIALVIIGLFAALISSKVQPDERDRLRAEADRLAQLLELAATEARMSGMPIAWKTDGVSYEFRQNRRGGGWSEMRGNDLFRGRVLPGGIKITGMMIEAMPADAMHLEFSPHASWSAYAIKMALGRERYTVAGSPVGDVRATRGEGKAE
ncbi:MAG: GspH/FimT family pseudopilin [Nitrosospira sp.]|nr:GspH/FimT family pseudopilin [Nitrosospira sp.]